MRRIIATSGVVALGLLAGCGGDAEPTVETITQTVTAEVADDSATGSPADEQEDENPTEPAELKEPSETEAGSDDDTSGGWDFGESEINARGNLVKDVGQWAGVGASSEDVAFAFRVTDIELGFKCTADWADPPEYGQFMALTLEVETTEKVANDPIPWIDFNPNQFFIYDDGGNRENSSVSTAAYSCLDEPEILPNQIGPAEKAKGMIVLDTGVTSGSVVLNGSALAGPGVSWSWDF